MERNLRQRLNKTKQNKDLEIGFKKEDDFASLMKKKPGVVSVIKSSTRKDMSEHWDRCFVYKNDKKIQIDIKGIKKYGDNWHTIEILSNIGNLGWLLGNADYIAFELSDKFICVNRLSLARFVLKLFLSEDDTNLFLTTLGEDIKKMSVVKKLHRQNKIASYINLLNDRENLLTDDGLKPEEKYHQRHMRTNWDNSDITTIISLEELEKLDNFKIFKNKK
jgi:hypothetical protein